MADHMRTELVTDALQMALAHRRPDPGLIWHSDQGSQFVSWPSASRPAPPASPNRWAAGRLLRQRRRRELLRHAQEGAHPPPHLARRRPSCAPRSSTTSRSSTTASAATGRSGSDPRRLREQHSRARPDRSSPLRGSLPLTRSCSLQQQRPCSPNQPLSTEAGEVQLPGHRAVHGGLLPEHPPARLDRRRRPHRHRAQHPRHPAADQHEHGAGGSRSSSSSPSSPCAIGDIAGEVEVRSFTAPFVDSGTDLGPCSPAPRSSRCRSSASTRSRRCPRRPTTRAADSQGDPPVRARGRPGLHLPVLPRAPRLPRLRLLRGPPGRGQRGRHGGDRRRLPQTRSSPPPTSRARSRARWPARRASRASCSR